MSKEDWFNILNKGLEDKARSQHIFMNKLDGIPLDILDSIVSGEEAYLFEHLPTTNENYFEHGMKLSYVYYKTDGEGLTREEIKLVHLVELFNEKSTASIVG